MAVGQPLRGLVGQNMDGRRTHGVEYAGLPIYVTGGASGSVTARQACIALIAIWGGGASGQVGLLGGGGAAACYARVPLRAGETITYVSPAEAAANGVDGDDAVVTLPRGRVMRAGGGKAAGPGGIATGGDLNRSGGAGGNAANGQAGEGPGGGAGGLLGGGRGGGGGAGGLTDVLSDFPGGPGTNGGGSSAGALPGGGTGADAGLSGIGGPGQVVIVLVTSLG